MGSSPGLRARAVYAPVRRRAGKVTLLSPDAAEALIAPDTQQKTFGRLLHSHVSPGMVGGEVRSSCSATTDSDYWNLGLI